MRIARLMAAAAALGAGICLMSTPAWSPLVDIPYRDWARGIQQLLDDVADARRLSRSEARIAERIAGGWVYLGPCEGSANRLSDTNAGEILQGVAAPNPKRALDAAILEMIALINLDGLGRGDREYACRFALAKANLP